MKELDFERVMETAKVAGAEIDDNGEIYTFSTKKDLFFFAEAIAVMATENAEQTK